MAFDNGLDNVFVAKDGKIRPGESPGDMLIVTRPETGASTIVQTPFKEGTLVYALHAIPLTVGADGALTVTGSTDVGANLQMAIILGKALNLQL
jgi:hypothetical protein